MTNQEIDAIIREHTGISVIAGHTLDANAVHLAVKAVDKRGLIYDVAHALQRIMRPGSNRELAGHSALRADPQEVAEAVAVAIQEEGRE